MREFVESAPSAGLAGIKSRSAARVADELVALFDHVSRMPDKVQWVYRHIADDLGVPLDAALDRACAAVASAIDADAASFDRHPYHNRQHFCEVTLTAHILCLLRRRDVVTTQFVLLAALVHDFVHEGASSEAFVLERASVARVWGLLEDSGLAARDLWQLTVLVLATDHATGGEFMAAVWRAHDQGLAVFPEPPADAPELAELVADPALAALARILCEADILPSIGLNLAHAMRLQDRLAREWERPLDRCDKLAFIDILLARGFIGSFFLPNVQATRAALAAAVNAHAKG
jgi:hypothetical protein